jgi:hypothetical protein
VKLAIDLVIVEEAVDALPEIDSEGVIVGHHDNVKDAEGDRSIEPRDDCSATE